MKVLWLGALHSDQALRMRKAPNPAAAKWTRGLIGGLKANGVEVIGLTHSYEQAWPKGMLFPGRIADFDRSIDLDWCRYLNVKGAIRDWTLGVAYCRKIRRIIKEKGIDALICYNVREHPYHVEAMRVAHEMGVPCFPIILDGDDPRRDNWHWVLDGTKYATGIVFLSAWMVKNYPGSLPILHLDGGCQAWHGDEGLLKRERNLIVYSGTLDHWRGLELLVQVVNGLKDIDYRFVICGKNDKNGILKLVKNDPRIEIKGFVTDEELHDISLCASAFVNTRDPKNGDNVLNFPSKIPNYLAYGKPIVSTWLPSLSEDYGKYLQIVDQESPEMFAAKIEEILQWNYEMHEQYARRVKPWFLENKLWSTQARRLKGWMSTNGGANNHEQKVYCYS